MAGAGGELGIVSLRIQAAAHDDEPLREFREARIDADRQRDVGQRPSGIDRYLMGMCMNLPNQKMHRVLGNWLGERLALFQRWCLPRTGERGMRRRGARRG